jgi:N utilization substance protein A
VPEVADELVEIVGVAREPGYRSKIAVVSHTDGVDPVGACVGPRGSRVRMVVSELRGEKIDIIPHNDEPARFVAKALSPARVREVLVDDENKQATVVVPDDQLSLAIGREGQNARLAAKLTGWRVDIKSETEFSQEDEIEFEEAEQEADGRCAAVLSAGRRCPNASLPGSRYCGLPQHQALARFGTNQVTVLSGLAEPEIAVLANADAPDGEVAEIVAKAEAAFEEEPAEAAATAEEEAPADAEEPAPAELPEIPAEEDAPDLETARTEREEAEEELAEAEEEAAEQIEEADEKLDGEDSSDPAGADAGAEGESPSDERGQGVLAGAEQPAGGGSPEESAAPAEDSEA